MRWLGILLVLLQVGEGFAQKDSVYSEESDSSYYVLFKNKLGVNMSPLFTSAFGGNNRPAKVAVVYKRNKGEKNLRLSGNYLFLANRTPYYAFNSISSTDSSITNRYYTSSYKQYDFRIGFEELRGASFSQFHIGADLIFGYGQFTSKYSDYMLTLDSLNSYRILDKSPIYEGSHISDYFIIGVDVSFGFDWFLSEEFTITLQLTPQFNLFLANTENMKDQYNQYQPITNFADFSLAYFDVMMFYNF